jgi:hypothetical protein
LVLAAQIRFFPNLLVHDAATAAAFEMELTAAFRGNNRSHRDPDRLC